MISLKNVSVSFGDKRVLEDYCLTVNDGEKVCIMGRSGCGKTTVSRLILGLLTPDSGSITGVPQKLSAVFQEDRLCEAFDALSNVRFATGGKKNSSELKKHLTALGLGDSLHTPVSTLSGGMRRRVAIARALSVEFDLLILDEPFNGLDAEMCKKTAEYILEQTKGKTVICITHDEFEAKLLGARIVNM